MPKYEISRWDAVITATNVHPTPMIYFKPDDSFSKYAEENDYQVLVQISGTESVYDDKSMLGFIHSSLYSPELRPNFFAKTGYFVITLACGWSGYPSRNGYVTLRGVKGKDKIDTEPMEEKTKDVDKDDSTIIEGLSIGPKKKKCNIGTKQVALVMISILGIFGLLLFISQRKVE